MYDGNQTLTRMVSVGLFIIIIIIIIINIVIIISSFIIEVVTRNFNKLIYNPGLQQWLRKP